MDRYFVISESIWLRQQRSFRNAQRIMISSLLFWSLFSIHAIIGYEARITTCAQSLGTTYDLFYSIYNIIISIVPLCIMIIFSVLTIINVRLVIKRVAPLNQPVNSNKIEQVRKRKKDIQLIRLSILQVIFYFILNIINSIYPLYSYLVTIYAPNLPIEWSLIVNLINSIGATLLYLYASV
jgi:hypothetical protein